MTASTCGRGIKNPSDENQRARGRGGEDGGLGTLDCESRNSRVCFERIHRMNSGDVNRNDSPAGSSATKAVADPGNGEQRTRSSTVAVSTFSIRRRFFPLLPNRKAAVNAARWWKKKNPSASDASFCFHLDEVTTACQRRSELLATMFRRAVSTYRSIGPIICF